MEGESRRCVVEKRAEHTRKIVEVRRVAKTAHIGRVLVEKDKGGRHSSKYAHEDGSNLEYGRQRKSVCLSDRLGRKYKRKRYDNAEHYLAQELHIHGSVCLPHKRYILAIDESYRQHHTKQQYDIAPAGDTYGLLLPDIGRDSRPLLVAVVVETVEQVVDGKQDEAYEQPFGQQVQKPSKLGSSKV